MYEFFDHTADLGIRVRAADLHALFAEAGRALTASLLDDPAAVRPTVAEEIAIPGDDHAYLLFDWLRELLIRFETRRILYADFDVQVDGVGLKATARGEPHDPSRHPLGHEVKAITYHGLAVERDGDGWVAEVVVDI